MDTWETAWMPAALREMRRLDRSTRVRVNDAVKRFATTGQGDVAWLAGATDELRLRVGDWRVRFRFDRGAGLLIVLHVGHRRDIYRGS